MPIVVGILALLLLGILAYGVWLIVQSRDRSASPAAPPTAAPPTATSTSATPRQTSSAPTTGPPTPTATTAAATVPVPQLVGLSEAAARAALERIGLTARVQFRPSDRTPGTVIDTSPRPGASVPAGSQVTLVIAQAPTTAPPSSPAPTATATPTG
jgi:hypothetical protein